MVWVLSQSMVKKDWLCLVAMMEITDLDSVELYNTQTEKWETTDIKLKDAKSYFGFLTVKLADVVSHL